MAMIVLVVEDEPLVRLGVEALLRELDHRPIGAITGKDALQKLENHPEIELLITDFRMPGLSGLELIAECRLLWPDLGTILMTGYSSQGHVFPHDGPVRLFKPFDINDLSDAIEKTSSATVVGQT